MSNYDSRKPGDGQSTREVPALQGETRRRRSEQGTQQRPIGVPTPFSRVTGKVRTASEETIAQESSQENREKAYSAYRAQTGISNRNVRRPVQAAGYAERPRPQTDRTALPPIARQSGRSDDQAPPPDRRPASRRSFVPVIMTAVALIAALGVLGTMLLRGGTKGSAEGSGAEDPAALSSPRTYTFVPAETSETSDEAPAVPAYDEASVESVISPEVTADSSEWITDDQLVGFTVLPDGSDEASAEAETIPEAADYVEEETVYISGEVIEAEMAVTSGETVTGDVPTVPLTPTEVPPVRTEDIPAVTSAPAEPVAALSAVPSAAPAAAAEPAEEEKEKEPRLLEVAAAESADPSLIKVQKIFKNSKKAQETYLRDDAEAVWVADAEHYLLKPYGVLTFRGSGFRQNAATGTVDDLSSMEILWTADAGSLQGTKTTFYGIGRNSQPVIVQWPQDIRRITNMTETKKGTSRLKEVIVAGEDGKIYFLDLADGQPTRDPINLGYPVHATPSIHPSGYPFMAVGQYGRFVKGKKATEIGMRCYDLLTQKQITLIDGFDKTYDRTIAGKKKVVGSFNTSPVFTVLSDDNKVATMLFAGTNGLLYLARVEIVVDLNDGGTMTAKISDVVLASQAAKQAAANTAVESSLAAYQNYVFYADKSGYLRCVDANTLTVRWAVDTGDTVESAVALDLDPDERLWLYTANTLQNRKKGDAQIRCYDAETGAERWNVSLNVAKPKKDAYIPGFIASPVIGQNDLAEYVYYTVSGLTAQGASDVFGGGSATEGALICLDKATGRIRWSYALDSYTYSSPVAVYSAEGKGWILQASADGALYLLDGQTGSLLQSIELEGEINGSPAVFGSTLVIGTQGKNANHIYGISLK